MDDRQNSPLLDDREELECRVCLDSSTWRAQAFTSYAKVRDELGRLTEYWRDGGPPVPDTGQTQPPQPPAGDQEPPPQDTETQLLELTSGEEEGPPTPGADPTQPPAAETGEQQTRTGQTDPTQPPEAETGEQARTGQAGPTQPPAAKTDEVQAPAPPAPAAGKTPPSECNETTLPRELDSILKSADKALLEALQAMLPDPRHRAQGPRRWWFAIKLFYSGARIEQAWTAIHRARAALYLLCPVGELNTQIEGLQELLRELPESSTQRNLLTSTLGQLKDGASLPDPSIRPQLREIYEQAINASDVIQREARILRNTLMTASGAIFAVVLTLGLAHVVDKEIVELCLKGEKHNLCPLGGSLHPFDVFAVELAGMLGGLLSVVIPLATDERIKTPYRVFNQQLVLKMLAGAATALAGVVLVESELISGFQFTSSSAILGYAIVFGFAQQIVTASIDRRADSLAKQTPAAKDV
jgi:hypothetical protein